MALSKEILKKIKEEEITPTARWYFFLRNFAVWLVGIFVIIAGGIVTALTIYRLQDTDWDVYKNLGQSPIFHAIRILPYLWIAVLIVFVVIAYYNVRNTKGGYRHATYIIIVGSVFGSLLLGTAFFSLGFGEYLDAEIGISVPAYETLGYNKQEIWTNPNEGLLSGQIISLTNGSSSFIIKDFSGNMWAIHGSPETIWEDFVSPQIGEQIKIIGKRETNNTFFAGEIRPWKLLTDPTERKIFYLRTNK